MKRERETPRPTLLPSLNTPLFLTKALLFPPPTYTAVFLNTYTT